MISCPTLRARGGHARHKGYAISHGVIHPAHPPALTCLELGGGGGGSAMTYTPASYSASSYYDGGHTGPVMTYAVGYGPYLGDPFYVGLEPTADHTAWTSFTPPGQPAISIPPTVPQIPAHVPSVPEMGSLPMFGLGLVLVAGMWRKRARR